MIRVMSKFKTIIISIFFLMVLVFATDVNATVQEKDEIIFKEKEYDVFHYLLEAYFSKHPDKKPNIGVEVSNSDRGYLAKFEVVNDELLQLYKDLAWGGLKDTIPYNALSDQDKARIKGVNDAEDDNAPATNSSGVVIATPQGEPCD